MVQRPGHYDRMNKNNWKYLRCGMEKDGACKMDRQNKKCRCARKSWRRKSNAGTEEEEENKLVGPLAKKELPSEGWKKVGGRRRYWMTDNIMINGLYEDTKRKAEKRVEWRILSLQ